VGEFVAIISETPLSLDDIREYNEINELHRIKNSEDLDLLKKLMVGFAEKSVHTLLHIHGAQPSITGQLFPIYYLLTTATGVTSAQIRDHDFYETRGSVFAPDTAFIFMRQT
jgi:hypothetical protein